jgi:hypothetical protein
MKAAGWRLLTYLATDAFFPLIEKRLGLCDQLFVGKMPDFPDIELDGVAPWLAINQDFDADPYPVPAVNLSLDYVFPIHGSLLPCASVFC